MSDILSKLPLHSRFVTYLGERFPLHVQGVMAAVFALSIASAYAGSVLKEFPELLDAGAAILVVLCMLFIMRVCDEFKDRHEDALYRPERAVPRGLISLRELGVLAGIAGLIQLATILYVAPGAMPFMVALWFWVALMSVEFFSPVWLRSKPVLYLISHMISMPLIALLVLAVMAGGIPLGVDGTILLPLLAFLAGLLLEIGRKNHPASGEREGVETYSRLWGRRTANEIWAITGFALHACGLIFVITQGSILATALLVLSGAVGLLLQTMPRPQGDIVMAGKEEVISGAMVLIVCTVAGASPWLF